MASSGLSQGLGGGGLQPMPCRDMQVYTMAILPMVYSDQIESLYVVTLAGMVKIATPHRPSGTSVNQSPSDRRPSPCLAAC